MQGGDHVDVDLNKRLKKGLSEAKKKDLLMIQAGGLWTASCLHKAGFLASPSCPWCGSAEEDLEHLWWGCPHHEHCRQKVRRLVADWTQLPKCLSNHGIPPEPAGDPTMPLWRLTDCPGDVREWDADIDGNLHGDDRLAWYEVKEQLEQEAAAAGVELDTKELTARQLALWIHGNFDDLPEWELRNYEKEEHEDITVYTDGGVDMGHSLWLGHGTWGVSTFQERTWMNYHRPTTRTSTPGKWRQGRWCMGKRWIRPCPRRGKRP